MNPHEQAILENFLDQLVRVRGTRKIPEADAMIRRAVDRQPDAAYLPLQRLPVLPVANSCSKGLKTCSAPTARPQRVTKRSRSSPQDVTVNNYYGSDERPNGADDDRSGRTDDPDPTEDEFVSDDDDADAADFI